MKKTKVGQVGKAEIKILIIIIYSAIIALIGLVASVYFQVNIGFQENIANYIVCESTGTSPNCELERSVTNTLLGMLAVTNLMFGFIPVTIFLVNCNPKHCKKILERGKSASSSRFRHI